MSQPLVVLRLNGRRADVILSRPAARNALNLQMCEELIAAFESVALHPEIAIVVLSAEGPVFCAGADMKERQGRDEAWVLARRRASFRAYDSIAACAIPVVCVVQGPLVGSGGEIAMSCDFILASDAATFRFPEPQWGTVGATQRLQRAIGISRAKELLYTGRIMEAPEALALGLVARLVTPEALAAETEAIVARILAAPALAMRLTKQCIDQGGRTDLASGIAIEMSAIERNLQQSDWMESVTRFAGIVGSGRQEKGS
jgi:enoyl-CoA hydratase/carnithine racemase